MAAVLKSEFQVSDAEGAVSPGDLAREALLVLARNPDHEGRLMELMLDDRTKSFGAGPVSMISAITAALVVLRTEVKVARGKDGKWNFSLKKRSASDGLLKTFVGKLAGALEKIDDN